MGFWPVIFSFFQFWDPWLGNKTRSLIFENRGYESEEPALITNGAQWGIPISNNCPTVVETSKKIWFVSKHYE
jgi:hypothetical protein